jgi:hypothetical protein
LWIIAPLK